MSIVQVASRFKVDFSTSDEVNFPPSSRLMLRLEHQYGLRSVALQWFSSYLSGRTFWVVYGGCTSSTIYIPCSVPQGSVLWPRLFILYTADLEDHVAEHKVSFHAFADDTQLYVNCRRDDVMSVVRRLENCIDDVSNVLVEIYIMRSSQELNMSHKSV